MNEPRRAGALATHGAVKRFLTGLVLIAVGVELFAYLTGDAVNGLQLHLPGIDKILHVAGFFTIYVACSWLKAWLVPNLRAGTPLLVLSIAVLAAGDEIGQGLSSTRQQDLADFAASLCGLLLGITWVGRRHRPLLAAIGGAAAVVVASALTFNAFTMERHINAAIRFERAGDFSGARREYQLALKAGVRTAGLYNELGWVEIESGEGDPRTAVEYATKALAMRPDDPDTLDTYGWALHHAGRSAEALPHLERAYAAKPDMFCIHYHLGQVFLALGDRSRAEAHFHRQVERTDTREAPLARQALVSCPGRD